jgi:shikimate kinase
VARQATEVVRGLRPCSGSGVGWRIAQSCRFGGASKREVHGELGPTSARLPIASLSIVSIDRLSLIGMMGAGKSTVGRLLARRCGFDFIDCDRELEARSGVSIATIFELEGEEGFRRREALLIDELTQRPRTVLATGGGAILEEENRRHLRERGLVIYLRVSLEEILRRTQKDRARPLLQTPDRRARVAQLLADREPLYEQTAHVTIQSNAGNPNRLVAKLIEDEQVAAVVNAARGAAPAA